MMNIRGKISQLRRVNFRRGDEHVENLLNKWGAVPEHLLSWGDLRMLRSYYYRYRAQIFDEKDEIKKMEWSDFWIEMNMRDALPAAEERNEAVKISEREKARQRRVNQISLFK